MSYINIPFYAVTLCTCGPVTQRCPMPFIPPPQPLVSASFTFKNKHCSYNYRRVQREVILFLYSVLDLVV